LTFDFFCCDYAGKLIAIGYSSHSTHHAQDIVINSIHTDFSSGSSRNSSGRKDKLKDGIVDSGEVARSRRLVLLRAESKRVNVDTSIRVAGVVLEGLDDVEVASFTLRESVLSVKLELSGDDRVLTPTVEAKSGLGKNECSGIGDGGSGSVNTSGLVRIEWEVAGLVVPFLGGRDTSSTGDIGSTSHLEKTRGIDECSGTGGLGRSTEGVDGRRKGIDGIGVVEGLSSKSAEKDVSGSKGGTVVNVGIRLNNPDELLARVVEVELDLVGRRSDRFITSELELLNEVFVGVLCHLASLVSIQEDVVNVERGSDKGLLVGKSNRLGSSAGTKGGDSPETLTERSDIKVDLNFVVLEGNQRKSQSRVAVEPEEKRNVESGLRKGIARSTNLGRSSRSSARSRDGSEGRISNVGKLSGVSNHLVVSLLLLGRKSKLVPDVHPITILTVDSLTTDFNLNLGDELLTNVVQPTGINTVSDDTGTIVGHRLVDLRKSDLEVGAVSQITIT
jgi:hypothetical protein